MLIFQKIKAFLILIEMVITVSFTILFMWLFNNNHWYFRKKWSRLQIYFIGCKITIKGKPDSDTQLVLMNHQSLLDIIVMESTYHDNLAWVAKKEIQKMTFFGQILTHPKMIVIDREDTRKSLVKLFKDVKDRLSNNRPIAMFPEGTRGDGKTLLPFKAGSKLIAEKLSLKVQPVVIVNTREIVDSQNFVAKKGEVILVYLDAIDPKEDKEWFDKLHTQMQETLDRELKLFA